MLKRFLTCFLVLATIGAFSSENDLMPQPTDEEAGDPRFSFGLPSTFRFGTPEQKDTLRQIAEAEFSLQHLPPDERDLLEEALSKSGPEVQNSCTVDQETSGKISAFMRTHKMEEHLRFSSQLGFEDLSPEDANRPEQPAWTLDNVDVTEYPYPFSEARVLAKIIPINLSSIKAASKSASNASYTANPSALLTAKLAPKDRILLEENLVVDFDVDLESRRMTRQSVYLKKPVKAVFGVRISKYEVTYEFVHDPIADQTVMTFMHHSMAGRIGLVFRPRLAFDTNLTYSECGRSNNRSYLYESIEAIRDLR